MSDYFAKKIFKSFVSFLAIFLIALQLGVLFVGSVNAELKEYTLEDLNNRSKIASEYDLMTISLDGKESCSSLLFGYSAEATKKIKTHEDRVAYYNIAKKEYGEACIKKLNEQKRKKWKDWEDDKEIRELKKNKNLAINNEHHIEKCYSYTEEDIVEKSAIYRDCFLGEEELIQHDVELIDKNSVLLKDGRRDVLERVKIRNEGVIPGPHILSEPFAFLVSKYDIDVFLDDMNICIKKDLRKGNVDIAKKYGLREVPVSFNENDYIYEISLEELKKLDKTKGKKDENCLVSIMSTKTYAITDSINPDGTRGDSGITDSIESVHWTVGTDTFIKQIEDSMGAKSISLIWLLPVLSIIIGLILFLKKRKKNIKSD